MDHYDDPPRRFPPSQTFSHVNGLTTPAVKRAVHKTNKSKPSKATGQRFQSINDFVDATMQKLKPTAALAWIVLWRDARNGIARTSQSDIARRVGVSRKTAMRAIAELEAASIVKRVVKGNSFKQCSAYEVYAKPTEIDP